MTKAGDFVALASIHLLGLQVALVASHYEQLSFGKAIEAIQKVSGRGNLFLQEKQPWTAFKKVTLFPQ